MIIEGYQCKDFLYKNSISETYRANQVDSGQLCIVKALNKPYVHSEESMCFSNDYEVAKYINYPEGVLLPVDHIISDTAALTVYHNFDGQALIHFIQKNTLSLSERLDVSVLLTKILGKIHNSNIIHNSISPHNVLYSQSLNKLSIIDCYLASNHIHQLTSLQPIELLEGGVHYISPEQTTRSNHDIDYRSDFYSLGLTLYKLFTGQTLFKELHKPFDIVQAHLHQQPMTPIEINRELPLALSNLIMKLINKDPYDRYHSTQGILWDLNKCLSCYEMNKKTEKSKKCWGDFFLGEKDILTQLNISNKLYDREQTVGEIINEFNLACQGQRRCVLITGPTGCGKTRIIKELYTPLTLKKGLFISGKFNQFYKIPYSVFLEAIDKVIKQVLLYEPKRVEYWKDKISTVLGMHGKLITDILPSLKKLIDPQPEVATLNIAATQERLSFLLKRLLGSFASIEHPLVLFIDDLQWADSESLRLFSALLEDSTLQYVFIISAYRKDDSVQSSNANAMVEKTLNTYDHIKTVTLKPLSLGGVKNLLHDTLVPTVDSVVPLCKVILKKTKGNPQAVKDLVKDIYGNNTLYFNQQHLIWSWDLSSIENQPKEPFKMSLMNVLNTCSHETKNVAYVAACLGDIFYIYEVSLVLDITVTSLKKDINQLLSCKIIKYLDSSKCLNGFSGEQTVESKGVQYCFYNKAIHEAIYQFDSVEKNTKLQFTIAEKLLEKYHDNLEFIKRLKITEHYYMSFDYIVQLSEHDKFVKIFIDTADCSVNFGAYATAKKYLLCAENLQSKKTWDNSYEIMLKLYSLLSTTSFCLGDHSNVFLYSKEVISNVKNNSDAILVHCNYAKALNAMHKHTEVQTYLSEQLLSFGIKIPVSVNFSKINFQYIKTNYYISLLNKKDLQAIPLIQRDSEESNITYFIDLYGWFSGQANNTNTMMLCHLERIKRIEKHGIDIDCALSFHGLATYYISSFWDIKMAMKLEMVMDKVITVLKNQASLFDYSKLKYITIKPWTTHLSDTLLPLKKEYKNCSNRGESMMAADYLSCYMLHQLMLGKNLLSVIQDVNNYLPEIRPGKTINTLTLSLINQFSENLRNPNDKPWLLNGKYLNEYQEIDNLKNNPWVFQLFMTLKIKLTYLFGNHQQALSFINELNKLSSPLPPIALTSWLILYRGLSYLSCFDEFKDKTYLIEANKDLSILKRISKHCPQNYAAMFYALKAKVFHVKDQMFAAEREFLHAMEMNNKFPNVIMSALINMLMMKLYIDLGDQEKVKYHQQHAITAFSLWGAEGKIKHMKNNLYKYNINYV